MSAENEARAKIALAKTMRNIAEAIKMVSPFPSPFPHSPSPPPLLGLVLDPPPHPPPPPPFLLSNKT